MLNENRFLGTFRGHNTRTNDLKLNDIYLLQLGIFMYKYQHNLLPINFANSFLRTDQVHNYNTRASRLFYVPSCRTNIITRLMLIYVMSHQFLCFSQN